MRIVSTTPNKPHATRDSPRHAHRFLANRLAQSANHSSGRGTSGGMLVVLASRN